MRRQARVELLLSRLVVGPDGERVGRIAEICADEVRDEVVVREYLLGPYGLLERLAAGPFCRSLLRALGLRPERSYRVPWDQLDLTDPEHPRLRVRRQELRRVA